MIRLACNLFISLLFSRGFDFFNKNFLFTPFFLEMERAGKRGRISRSRPGFSRVGRALVRTGASSAARAAAARVASGYWNRATPMYVAPRVSAARTTKELKGVDIANISAQMGVFLATYTTNGAACVLNCVQPGSGSWNRVGRRILMKSVRIRGTLEALLDNNNDPANNTTRGMTIRMVVVYDKQPSSGAVPTWNTIFGHTDQSGTENASLMDGLRYDNTGRFTVIRDKQFSINPMGIESVPAGNAGVIQTRSFDEYIPLKGLETIYSGQSNPCTIADISSGALYLFCRYSADTANSAANFMNQTCARLRFYD